MTPLERLTEAVNELTTPRTHREPLLPDMAPISAKLGHPIHGSWLTHTASLLDQLLSIGPGGIGESGKRTTSSTPNAKYEGIDCLILIDQESSRWIHDLDLHDRHQTAANLRSLVGAGAHMEAADDDPGQLRELANQARRWQVMAAVLTTWDVRPFTPRNTCPLCGMLGALRIRAGNGTATATCVNCHETWDHDNIGLLSEHIRRENLDEPMSEAS